MLSQSFASTQSNAPVSKAHPSRSKRTDLIGRRNQDIRTQFAKMRSENKYTTDFICRTLGERFYISERTVYDIVIG